MTNDTASNGSGVLYVVATPIGNLGDMTFRAVEVLKKVDRIAAEDTRHSKHLLAHYDIRTPSFSFHEHNEKEAARGVIKLLLQGRDVALISDAGTPLLSDPGFPLVRACREQGIRVSPLPGASALVAALSVAGLPTDSFRFEGFLPRNRSARGSRLEALAAEPSTLVFYESSHRITDALQDLQQFMGQDRMACIGRELTKIHEDLMYGTLGEVMQSVAADSNRRKGEFVIIVQGNPPAGRDELPPEVLDTLRILMEELPLKQAAALGARLTGAKKNRLYQIALTLQE